VSSSAMRKSPVPPRQLTDLLTHLAAWQLLLWQYLLRRQRLHEHTPTNAVQRPLRQTNGWRFEQKASQAIG
jgi:hypothetical protein